MVSAPKEPHVPLAGNPARTRSGRPCKECIRVQRKHPERKCRKHGGASSGPKSAEGKAAASSNAITHGAKQRPEKFRERMSPEQKAAFERLVDEVMDGEGLTALMDRFLVRDLVTAELLLHDARGWLMEKGLVLADSYVKSRNDYGTVTESPEVPAPLLEAMRHLARLKERVHERLRSGTGKVGDAGKHTIDDPLSRAALDDPEVARHLTAALHRATKKTEE